MVELGAKKSVYSATGLDAYWSPDGHRLLFSERSSGVDRVSIHDFQTSTTVADVAPPILGGYLSWGVTDKGQDIVLTIRGNYYVLDGNRGRMPADVVEECPGIGQGDRPLLSKDGSRITTFVGGEVVVRNLRDCQNVVRTGLKGAKADFSWDGRYIAFHAPRPGSDGYDIVVVDLKDRTFRQMKGLGGSSFFPSWTLDGRLAFRYEGPEYRGFMLASGVLGLPARPLPTTPKKVSQIRWSDVFAETEPSEREVLVVVGNPWVPHVRQAVLDVASFLRTARDGGAVVAGGVAYDPVSFALERPSGVFSAGLRQLQVRPGRFQLTAGVNQIPSLLLFENGLLLDQRLGHQSPSEIEEWVASRRRQK